MKPKAPIWAAVVPHSRLLSRASETALFAAALAPTPAAIRSKLAEIFKRSEFQPGRFDPLWQKFWEWLARQLSGLSGLQTAAPWVFWTIITACIVVLLLILIHIGWTIRQVFFLQATGLGEGASDRDRLARSGEFYDQAIRKAAENDYTEAVRYLFLALVYRFDESGEVLFPKARTNREYLALFRDQPSLQANLRVFVDLLDENWYGRHVTAHNMYDKCLFLYDQMIHKGV